MFSVSLWSDLATFQKNANKRTRRGMGNGLATSVNKLPARLLTMQEPILGAPVKGLGITLRRTGELQMSEDFISTIFRMVWAVVGLGASRTIH